MSAGPWWLSRTPGERVRLVGLTLEIWALRRWGGWEIEAAHECTSARAAALIAESRGHRHPDQPPSPPELEEARAEAEGLRAALEAADARIATLEAALAEALAAAVEVG